MIARCPPGDGREDATYTVSGRPEHHSAAPRGPRREENRAGQARAGRLRRRPGAARIPGRGTGGMHRQFKRSFESLEEIFAFTGRFFQEHGVPEDDRHVVDLAVEELFTNLVKYNSDAEGEIGLGLERDGAALKVSLTDREREPFDVTVPREVDIEAPYETRPSGGLGLYLVQAMVDSLDYAHEDGVSTIVFTRKLG